MSRARSSTSVGTDVVLRAGGVALIVLDHAISVDRPAQILAGLNVLLMVTGFSLARFLPQHPSGSDLRAALFRAGRALAVPCFAALVASAILFRRVYLPDLLLIGNWFTFDHVAFFPAWYPMELLQYFALLAVVVSLPGFGAWHRRSPWLVAFGLLLFAVIARGVQSYLWSQGYFDGGGPHLMFWNLMAGWFLFAATRAQRRGRLIRWASFAVVALLAIATWGPSAMRAWTTIGAALALLLALRVTLPFALGRVLSLVSQAALTIYIFHMPAVELFNRWTATSNSAASGLVAIMGCTMVWAAWTAMVRSYRSLSPPPELRGGARGSWWTPLVAPRLLSGLRALRGARVAAPAPASP